MKFEELRGETIISIEGEQGDGEMTFTLQGGRRFKMLHEQDCCEYVYLEDVSGDLRDLIGRKILFAEEVTSNDQVDGRPVNGDSWTWTFYKLATDIGYVTLRWLGESNGYYSEAVSLVEIGTLEEIL